MVAALHGVIISQLYGDNSGGAEFDSDGDGTLTQEDEFVSVANISSAPLDVSGWEIWSIATGGGADDPPQNVLYHVFPPGTVLGPGETLHIINEISGSPASNAQEASEGGIESGSGGVNTNLLSEGWGDSTRVEGIALLNPNTGDYIVLDLSVDGPTDFTALPGFTGTSEVARSNAAADSGVEDQNAGFSYQYDYATGQYTYGGVVICFDAATLIETPSGPCRADRLSVGQLVWTLDHGPQPIKAIMSRKLNFAKADSRHKPIEIKPDALGPAVPSATMRVSPQHRILLRLPGIGDCLVPAKTLIGRRGVRQMAGVRRVTYVHLVFDRHEIVQAHGCWSESLYPGEYVSRSLQHCQTIATTARPLLRPGNAPKSLLHRQRISAKARLIQQVQPSSEQTASRSPAQGGAES
ncbi:Hint domain-containing protein [Sagittula sp. SSi028]|uniref:Hint domain-containing protein n=1 Tax=Sagittula sp. SSi028 TaxID=3400636 RepID=UPI003AF76511